MRKRFRGKNLRGPRVYRITRLCSSNYQQNYGIALTTSATGFPQFTSLGAGAASSDTVTFSFSLAGVNVYIGGQGALLSAPTYVAGLPQGVTDLGALFDCYMIEKIEIMGYASWAGNSVTAATQAGQLPYIIHAFDNDDAFTTSASAIMQKTGAKYDQMANMGNGTRLATIRPSQAIQMYNTTTTTGYAPRRGFIDMASPNVPHYGFKMALDNANTGYATNQNIGTLNLVFKYHVKLKFTI